MSLLDKASLVQIPSGYGDGKLYSEVPNTTAGDFTFTRASTGTRVNADGYIEEVPWNIASYSEDYSSGSWVATNLSVTTDDTTSPRGDTTADKITTTTSGIENRIRNSSFYQAPSTEHTFSAYAKKGNVNWFLLRNIAYGNLQEGRVWFDLENGVVGTINTGFTASIEDVGDGWFRCSMTCTTTSNPLQIVDFSSATNDNDFQSDSVGEFCYVWGVQLVKGDSPKPYIKTTDRLNIPRLDYSGGASCASLLLEPQRTNEVTYSEDYSSGWSKSNTTIIANNATSPRGTQDATKIYPNSSGNYRHIRNNSFNPSSGLYTFSIYAKAGELDHLVLIDYDGGGIGIDFDLTNGVATDNASTPFDSFSMTDVGNGWYRCVATATDMYFYWILSDNGGLSVTANGTDGLFIWGAMAEQGSFPTSYIPTSGTSVTRVEDECNNVRDATLFNDAEGVLFTEIAVFTSVGSKSITLSDGTNSNRILINYRLSSNVLDVNVISGGSYQVTFNYTGVTNPNSLNKIAFKYKENDFALWVNGVEVFTDTSGLTPNGLDELNLASVNGSSQSYYGKVKQLIYFNEALTDEELETLTTI